MLKDLLKEGGLYTLANLLTKGVSLMLIPFYTAYFTPAEYGLYDILTVFGVFVGNIFSLQLNQGLARFVAEPTFTEQKKIQFASTGFIGFLIPMTIFLIIAIVFSNQFISFLSPNQILKRNTFIYAILTIYLNNIFYFLNVYLRFTRKVKIVSLLSFLHAIFGILLLMYFVFNQDSGMNSFFLPYLIIVPILILTQLVILKEKLKFEFSNSAYNQLIKYSVPLIGGALALVTMNLTDRIFINEMRGENELGVYGIGIKFASIIGIVVAGFSTALGPLVYEKHNQQSTRDQLGELFKLFIGIGVGGAFVISLFSQELVNLFTTYSYHEAGNVLPIMIFTTLFSGFLMFSPGLQIKKKTKVISLLTLVFAVLNILLNYILIPKFHLYGAAIATLVSTALYGFIYLRLSIKVYPYPINLTVILIPFVFSLIVMTLIQYIQINSIYLTGIKILSILVYAIIILKLGLLKKIIKI
ncbi:MAG: lipopolysaccharide biosynthesis protein [Putridiphycobacter sp.]